MNTYYLLKKLLLGSCLLAGNALAFSGTISVNASIGDSLTVTQGAEVSYGTIVADASATVITMSSTGAISQTGTATVEGNGQPGTFAVSGTSGHTVSLSYANATLSSGGANSMVFSPATTMASSCVIGTNCGTDNLKVYGNLDVGANQAKGSYSGNLTVTVNYNNV